ncbi:MAG: HEAT repeat domain-containing protein, partial [Bacteroidota bacterium]
MLGKTIAFAASLGLLVIACAPATSVTDQPINRWADSTLRIIYTLQDERNVEALLPYLEHPNDTFRLLATRAFASISDTQALLPLATRLADSLVDVRQAAAFALGQQRHARGDALLIERYAKERSNRVARVLLEAIGKGPSSAGMTFLCSLDGEQHPMRLAGQAEGLYWRAVYGTISDSGTARVLALLQHGVSDEAYPAVTSYLERTRQVDYAPYREQLLAGWDEVEVQQDPFVAMNLIRAIASIPHPTAEEVVLEVLQGNRDYRIKINALRGSPASDTLLDMAIKLTQDTLTNVAVVAAQYLTRHAVAAHAPVLLATAETVPQWRTRALLLGAAMKHHTDKLLVKQRIITLYAASNNPYEKGWLLKALAQDPRQHLKVNSLMQGAPHMIIRTAGLEALMTIRRHPDYDSLVEDGTIRADVF